MKRYWTMEKAVEKAKAAYSWMVNDVRVEEIGCLCGCCDQVLSAKKEDELRNYFLKDQLIVPFIRTSYKIGEERKYEILIFNYNGELKEIKEVL